jgi:hypothetical protein
VQFLLMFSCLMGYDTNQAGNSVLEVHFASLFILKVHDEGGIVFF